MPTLEATEGQALLSFTCEAGDLYDAVKDVQTVLGGREILPILKTIHLSLQGGRLYLSGTDLEVYLTRYLDVTGQASGRAAVAPERLTGLLKNTPEEETIIVQVVKEGGDTFLKLQSQSGAFSEEALDAEDHPSDGRLDLYQEKNLVDSTEPENTLVSQPGSVLGDLLKRAAPFVLHQNASGKEALQFVHLEVLRPDLIIRASDGSSLFRASVNVEGRILSGDVLNGVGHSILLPRSLCSEVGRFEDESEIVYSFHEKFACFSAEGRIVSGQYSHREPLDIDTVLPDDDPMYAFEVEATDLTDALTRAGCYSHFGKTSSRTKGTCRLGINKDFVTLTARSVEGRLHMRERLPVEVEVPRAYGPAEGTANFNLTTIRRAISAFGDTARIEFYGAGKPVFLRYENRLVAAMPTVQ